jgi:hypothetical protein
VSVCPIKSGPFSGPFPFGSFVTRPDLLVYVPHRPERCALLVNRFSTNGPHRSQRGPRQAGEPKGKDASFISRTKRNWTKNNWGYRERTRADNPAEGRFTAFHDPFDRFAQLRTLRRSRSEGRAPRIGGRAAPATASGAKRRVTKLERAAANSIFSERVSIELGR